VRRAGPVAEGRKMDDENDRIARTIQLWDTATGKEWKKIEVDAEYGVDAVAFSPDKKGCGADGSGPPGVAGPALTRPSWGAGNPAGNLAGNLEIPGETCNN
jgi:hypothetical protein